MKAFLAGVVHQVWFRGFRVGCGSSQRRFLVLCMLLEYRGRRNRIRVSSLYKYSIV